MLELKLLGAPTLSWRGVAVELPAPKPFAVLSYLATVGEARSRGELLELFWTAGKPANLRFALHKLRGLPGSDAWLHAEGSQVRVDADSDVRRFLEALREGRSAHAVAAWRDGENDKTYLRGFELPDAPRFTSWLEEERQRLEAQRLGSLAQAVELLEVDGKTEEALDLAHCLVELDPLDEATHRSVMRLEHAAGRRERALAQFEACRMLLDREVGTEPSPETLAVLATIEGPSAGAGADARILEVPGEAPHLAGELVGRAALVEQVATSLDAGERILLHGLGGVGKTALAAALVDQHVAGGAGPALWVQVGHDPPEALFDATASALDARQEVRRARDPGGAVRRALRGRGVSLVVLDDVWNAYGLSKLLEAVPKKVPVLVTSRHRYPQLARREVGRLSRPAALELLGLHAGCPVHGDEDAGKLCELLGDHAFAIRLAGILLAVDGGSPRALLERVRDRPHALRLPPELAEGERESVASLLTASLDELDDEAHEAFMAFGALYAPTASPELLALCVRRDAEETEDALFELQRRGLAQRIAEPGRDRVRYELHDLAFSFARAHSHFRPRTAELACEALLERCRRDFGALDVDLVHLLGAARAFRERGDDERLVAIIAQLVVGHAYFQARGHTPASLDLLSSAVGAAKRSSDLANAQRLSARLGDAHRELYADYDAALAAFGEALELARARGDAHGEVVMQTLLGTTLSQKGSSNADVHLQYAQSLAERLADARALCQVLEHRGCLAVRERRHEEAQRLFAAGFQALDRLAGDATVDPAELARLRYFLLLNSGEAEREAGRLREALERRAEALDVAKQQANQVWMAYALHELGETHHQLGERQRAREACSRAADLYRANGVTSALRALTAFLEHEGYGPQEVFEVGASPPGASRSRDS